MKFFLGISNCLEEISSLSHSIVFLYFFTLIIEEGFLISPCYSLELCIQMGISFLFSFAFSSLLFSAIYKASSDNRFAFFAFLFCLLCCTVNLTIENECTLAIITTIIIIVVLTVSDKNCEKSETWLHLKVDKVACYNFMVTGRRLWDTWMGDKEQFTIHSISSSQSSSICQFPEPRVSQVSAERA